MGDREAFLRSLGITNEDIASPEEVLGDKMRIDPNAPEETEGVRGAGLKQREREGVRDNSTSHLSGPPHGSTTTTTTAPSNHNNVKRLAEAFSVDHGSGGGEKNFNSGSPSGNNVKKLAEAFSVDFGGGGGGGDEKFNSNQDAAPKVNRVKQMAEAFASGTPSQDLVQANNRGEPPHRNNRDANSQSKEPPTASAPAPQGIERENLDITQLPSEELKFLGNEAFEDEDFQSAIELYTMAIEKLCQKQHKRTPEGRDAYEEDTGASEDRLLSVLHSNRSAAYLQKAVYLSVEVQLSIEELGEEHPEVKSKTEECDRLYDRALFDAESATNLRPDWFKGYARQADVYFILQKYPQAADNYEMALHLEPRNRSLIQSLEESREAARVSALDKVRQVSRQSGVNSSNTSMEGMPPPERGSTAQAGPQRPSGRAGGRPPPSTSFDPSDREDSTQLHRGGKGPSPPPPPSTTLSEESSGRKFGKYFSNEITTRTASSSVPHRPTPASAPQGGREASSPAPDTLSSGEAYRLAEVERFRQRKEGREQGATAGSYRSTAPAAENGATTASSLLHPTGGGPSRRQDPGEMEEDLVYKKLLSLKTAPESAATHSTGNTRAPAANRATVQEESTRNKEEEEETDARLQRRLSDIKDRPYEFSSAAASAYQKKLLEEYRQRKRHQ